LREQIRTATLPAWRLFSGQIREFSRILSEGLPKVAKRFMGEVMYGMLSRQSVHVAQIARSLKEPIRPIKTLNRLCRQLGREGLGEKVTENLISEGAAHVGQDTVLIADVSDISKKYAKKMEHLAEVRDGSEGTIGKGYQTVQVAGAEVERGKISPLYERL
jgi:DNA polymerase III alpha subunit